MNERSDNNWKLIIIAVVLSGVSSMPAVGSGHWESRVHRARSQTLIGWLDWERMPKDMQQDEEARGSICRELVARREVPLLLTAYATSTNSAVRDHLVSGVLYGIDDKRIEKAFAGRVNEQEDEENYYALTYLAKRGNTNALDILNRHYYQYPVSSWQWSFTVELFGKAKYKPAISNLVESLDAASLSVSGAACWSLGQIFPDAPEKFKDPSEAQRYYAERLKRLPDPTVQRPGPPAGQTNRIHGGASSR